MEERVFANDTALNVYLHKYSQCNIVDDAKNRRQYRIFLDEDVLNVETFNVCNTLEASLLDQQLISGRNDGLSARPACSCFTTT
jgi:hypothetical protein